MKENWNMFTVKQRANLINFRTRIELLCDKLREPEISGKEFNSICKELRDVKIEEAKYNLKCVNEIKTGNIQKLLEDKKAIELKIEHLSEIKIAKELVERRGEVIVPPVETEK